MAKQQYRYIRNGVDAELITDAATEVTSLSGNLYNFDNGVENFDFTSETTPATGDQVVFPGDYDPYLIPKAQFDANLVSV